MSKVPHPNHLLSVRPHWQAFVNFQRKQDALAAYEQLEWQVSWGGSAEVESRI